MVPLLVIVVLWPTTSLLKLYRKVIIQVDTRIECRGDWKRGTGRIELISCETVTL